MGLADVGEDAADLEMDDTEAGTEAIDVRGLDAVIEAGLQDIAVEPVRTAA